MDYAEALQRIREETKNAHLGFVNKKFVHAETAALELLRLSCKLLDEAENAIAVHLTESAGKRKAA